MKEKIALKDNLKKIKISVEDLVNEGWEDTFCSFGHLRVYKRDNSRILYNPKEEIIDYQYFTKRKF